MKQNEALNNVQYAGKITDSVDMDISSMVH